MDAISKVGLANTPSLAPSSNGKSPTESFGDVFNSLLKDASAAQNKAASAAKDVQMDASDASIEKSVIAMNEAQLKFQLVVQVRNKIQQAYSELQNIPV